MNDDLIFAIIALLFGIYFARMWMSDLRDWQKGKPHPKALPGSTPTTWRAVWIAVAGSLVILGIETLGEYALGISEEQKDIAVILLVPMIMAAFVEELIFRGFLVVGNRGKAALWGSILFFSVLFALAHSHLWSYQVQTEGGNRIFEWHFTVKAFWSAGMVFLLSVWLYAARFLKSNPHRSLLPCMAGHLAKNLGVFVIKLAQGHVSGWL